MSESNRGSERIVWRGGAYPDREGIALRATEAGLEIEPWYDGGIWFDIHPDKETGHVTVPWLLLDAMREEVESGL